MANNHSKPWSIRRAYRAGYLAIAICAGLAAGAPALADGKGHNRHDGAGHQRHWVGTWSTSPQPPFAADFSGASGFPPPAVEMPSVADQTLRLIVHTTIGGRLVRIRLSNTYGESPVTIDAASIAIHAGAGDLIAGSMRELTFGGEDSVTIPRGARVLSDPVKLRFPDQTDLAVSLYLAEDSGLPTVRGWSNQTSYVATGNRSVDETGTDFDEFVVLADEIPLGAPGLTPWYFLTGVEVLAHAKTHAVVALGDSITEGFLSSQNANARYPDFLARRLLDASHGKRKVAVLNAGLGGNRILNDTIVFGESALARLDRDVLTQSGVRWVILMEGMNDIGFPEFGFVFPSGTNVDPVPASQIINGMKQIIARTKARGLKIFGGTLLPCAGAFYCTPAAEERRQTVNAWIRDGGAFDAVIDFDEALQDPQNPAQLLPEYDSGDHLHPNDAGYEAMADAVNLRLFRLRHGHHDD